MCVPSRVAFWTGMYPHNTGVRHNQVLMPEDRSHYARLLSDAGYRMALIGKDHCFQGPPTRACSQPGSKRATGGGPGRRTMTTHARLPSF